MQRKIYAYEYECDKCGLLEITKSTDEKGKLPKNWFAIPGIYPYIAHYCNQCYNDQQIWKTKWICIRCGNREKTETFPEDWIVIDNLVFCEFCK